MARLADDSSMAARCLRFLMLTATRSAEARGARWSEIDLGQRLWTIPAARTKGGRHGHRVPLSEPALAILTELAEVRTSDLVFPGRFGVIDNSTLPVLLHRLGHRDITVHGMRSVFADWAADHGQPGDLTEMALAHAVGSQVERSYRRSDVLERRRALMEQWAAFLTREPAQVIPLRATA